MRLLLCTLVIVLLAPRHTSSGEGSQDVPTDGSGEGSQEVLTDGSGEGSQDVPTDGSGEESLNMLTDSSGGQDVPTDGSGEPQDVPTYGSGGESLDVPTASRGEECLEVPTASRGEESLDDLDADVSAQHERAKYRRPAAGRWRRQLTAITEAVQNYVECRRENCGCYADVIKADLAPFQASGISRSMVEEARPLGVTYQIIDHKLYREVECMFEFRCRGVEHFMLQLVDTLPDMELVLNARDWPTVHRQHGRRLPVFSFSKTAQYLDITYPAWAFWTGGPAIALYPTGIGRWDQHVVSISAAARKHPWKLKKSLAFFRGSRTSSERDPLIRLSRRQPALVDAQYTKNQAWRSEADTLGAAPAPEVSFEQHCQYKYLFNFRGVAASFRLKHLFLCGGVVFHVGDEWTEFFYGQLQPWVHYVPVRSNPTLDELEEVITFARENDDVVKEIAERGQQFILDNLRMKDVTCFWRKLLSKYAKLLDYKVEKRSGMMLVPHRD